MAAPGSAVPQIAQRERQSINVRKLRSTTLILVAIGIGACTAPGRLSLEPLVAKPATWTNVEVDARTLDPDTVLIQDIACHPESYQLANTELWVLEIASNAAGGHRDILERRRWYSRSQLNREVLRPVMRPDLAGLDALTLEINLHIKSPHDRSTHHYNRRYWSVPFRKRIVLVVADQPIGRDPECSLELEKTIREILNRLAAEQSAAAGPTE